MGAALIVGRMIAAPTASSGADIAPVVVLFIPSSSTDCADLVFLGEKVSVSKMNNDTVLWVIHNTCPKRKFSFTLAVDKPVKNCKLVASNSYFDITTQLEIDQGKAAVIQCAISENASTVSHKYHINSVVVDQGPGVRSHELDIGVSP
jgi:hypothetical protein